MNNNLVADKRPDKNGNLVTRWIRSFGGRNTAMTIPAPAAPSLPGEHKLRSVRMTEEREQQYMYVARKLRVTLEFGNRNNIEPSLETVAKYDPDLLDRIEKSVDSSDFDSRYWAEVFGNQAGLSDEFPKHLENMLRRHHASFVVNPLVQRIAASGGGLGGDVFSAMQIGEVVDNITRGKPIEDFDETIAAVTMIVYIKKLHIGASWSDAENQRVTYSQILEDAKHIATRVDEVERILPELYQRGVYDRETIDILLGAPSPSLMDGLL